MSLFITTLLSLIFSAAICALIFHFFRKAEGSASASDADKLKIEASVNDIKERYQTICDQLVPSHSAIALGSELRTLEENVKGENIKVSVSLSEIQALEMRLQELEEIRREIEVSASEVKDELQSLKEREADLLLRRQELEVMLQASAEKMSTISSELAISDEMQVQIERMQGELVSTQDQCDRLLEQIKQGNEQCILMKQRYNALDIEYALLYERFARIEASQR